MFALARKKAGVENEKKHNDSGRKILILANWTVLGVLGDNVYLWTPHCWVCVSVSSMEHAKNRNTLYVEISIDLQYSLSEIKISSP